MYNKVQICDVISADQVLLQLENLEEKRISDVFLHHS